MVIVLYSLRTVGWALAGHLLPDSSPMPSARPCTPARPAASCSTATVAANTPAVNTGASWLRYGIRQSRSARANSHQNVWTESLMGTLKTGMLQDGCFIDAVDARTGRFGYIESYYHHHRRHSFLAYQTPAQFEACKLSPA